MIISCLFLSAGKSNFPGAGKIFQSLLVSICGQIEFSRRRENLSKPSCFYLRANQILPAGG